MKLTDILAHSPRPFASFEIVPPLKGSDATRLYDTLEPLLRFRPPFINVTCHRDEVEYRDNGDGTFSKLTLRRRPGTIAIVAAIMKRCEALGGDAAKTEVVPHVICGGASRTTVESELLDLHFLGVQNIMALRGDAMPGQKKFVPDPDGFAHPSELVSMIGDLNRGVYLDPGVKDGVATDFCVGVAGYPEKHFEAANIDEDIERLKEKVDAGAGYIVTQMCFDNSRFYDFRDRCRAAGITVPIIPGLKPLVSARQVDNLPRAFHIDIPEALAAAMRQATTKEDAVKVGVSWAVEQSRDLLKHNVPAIHYYTMSRARAVSAVVEEVF